MSDPEDLTVAPSGPFPETSLTLYQRIRSESPGDSRAALEEFFNSYWYPLYSFLRIRGESHENASDLLQDFVMRELLEREQIQAWKSEKGRLRTFLKVALDRFRMREYRKESAAKRGGPKAQTHVSMDFEWAEGHFANTPIDYDSPDKIFEKAWAEATVQQALSRLATEYGKKDKIQEFQLLCQNLSSRAGDGDHVKYGEIARALNTSENNVKQKMRDFRGKFKRVLESVISELAAEGEVEEEIQFVSKLVMGRE